jgi:hypothetical protein
MAVFDLLAHGIDWTARRVVLFGLVFLDNFNLNVRAEVLETLMEVTDIVVGAFSRF